MRTFYNKDTGRFISRHTGNAGPSPGEDVGFVEGWYDPPDDYYYPSGVPTARAAISYTVSDSTPAVDEEITVSDLPTVCTVYYDTDEYSVTDGTFDFTPTTVGEYVFTVNEPEYLVTEITITCQ